MDSNNPMAHILYNGHECLLTDVSAVAEEEIKQTLQYTNLSEMSEYIQRQGMSTDRAREEATHKLYNNGCFPSGCLPRVRRILKAHGQTAERHNNYSPPDFQEYDFDKLLQKLELDKVDHQVDLLETIKSKNRGIIVIPTGGGKAFSAGFILNYFPNAKILVTVPKTDLQIQLMDTLSFTLGEKIGKLGGGGKRGMERVTVATLHTASKRPSLLKDIQIWIADECHEMPEMQKKISAAMPQCAVRFGLTATPDRKDRAHFEIEGVHGPVIYKTSRAELEENGFILKPKIFNIKFIHRDTSLVEFKGAIPVGSSGYIYKDYRGRITKPNEADHHVKTIVENDERNDLIIKLFTQFLNWNERTGPGAIFTGRVGHAHDLAERLRSLGYEVYAISSASTKAEKERNREVIVKARRSEIDGVIAADILNTGTDIRPLQFALMAESCANATIITQRIGRILRSPRNGEIKSGAFVAFIEDDEHWWLSARAGKAKEFVKTEFPNAPILDVSYSQFETYFPCSQKPSTLTQKRLQLR